MGPISEKVERADVIVGDAPAVAAAPAVALDYAPSPAAAPADDGPTLKQRAVRGSIWTMGAFGIGQAVRLFSVPILTRLLLPEHFGTVGLIAVFVTGLSALSDVGIEQAIIQNKRGDDPVFLNTAWTLHVVRGFMLWLGCCLIAFPVYWLYRDKGNAHDLLVMMPVAGLVPLLAGFNSTNLFSLNRHLQMGRITALTLAHQLTAVAVQIVLAYYWRSPWAIILGGIAATIFVLVASHTVLPGIRNRFCWDRQVRGELMTFGRWIMVSTLVTYAAMQIDRPMMGLILTEAWLGLYMVALNLVRLPTEIISRLAHVTLFPALSRTAEADPADLRRVFLRARGMILSLSLALTVGVVLGGPLFIKICFTKQWHQAGFLAQWASIGAWFVLLQCSADRALLALGKTRILATSNTVNLVVTVAGGFLGRWVDMKLYPVADNVGILGFIIGMSLGKLAGHVMIQIEMARSGIGIVRQDVVYSALLVLACVVGVAAPELVPKPAGDQMLYTGVAAVAVCGVTCGVAGVKLLRGIRS